MRTMNGHSALQRVFLHDFPANYLVEYLADLGIAQPTVHVVSDQDPQRTVTEDVLEDAALLGVLAGLGARGARLTAHGVSEVEELLAARAGIGLAADIDYPTLNIARSGRAASASLRRTRPR